MSETSLRATFLFLMLASFCLVAEGVNAHAFHHSLAQISVNTENKTLEVSLKVVPETLETALQQQAGKPINLERSENVDAEIVQYLWQHFRFVTQDKKKLGLIWAGKEVSHKATWLHFEIAYGQPQTLTLKNTLLQGVESGKQVNTVIFNQGSKRQKLMFDESITRHKLIIE